MYLPMLPFSNPVILESEEAFVIKNNVPVLKAKLLLLLGFRIILLP